VDLPRRVARKQLEREERRAAAGRAFVLQPTAEELGLLAEAKLADRAVGDGPFAVLARPHRLLELVRPLAPQVGKLALLALLRQLVRDSGCLGERQTDVSDRSEGPTYSADGRKSRPVRFCSRMCADQPA